MGTQLHSPGSPWTVCGGQRITEADFLPSILVFPRELSFYKCCILIWSSCNGPVWGIDYVLNVQGIVIWFSAVPRELSLLQNIPDYFWGLPSLLFGGYWGLFPWKWRGQSMQVATHPCPLLRLRMIGAVSLLSHTPSWQAQGQLYFIFTKELHRPPPPPYKIKIKCVRSEVLSAVLLKDQAFCDVLCHWVSSLRCFTKVVVRSSWPWEWRHCDPSDTGYCSPNITAPHLRRFGTFVESMLNVWDLLCNFKRHIKMNLNHYIQWSQLKVKWLYYPASSNVISDINVHISGHTETEIDGIIMCL
jgi:hypothetical protein